jgi:hypothetical protein
MCPVITDIIDGRMRTKRLQSVQIIANAPAAAIASAPEFSFIVNLRIRLDEQSLPVS